MRRRLLGAFVVALLGVAVLAAPAGAQQVSPGGGNAEGSQYVSPEQGGTLPGTGGGGPGTEGGGELGAGQLPFTGLMILPLVLAGTFAILLAVALRRRANAHSPHAAS